MRRLLIQLLEDETTAIRILDDALREAGRTSLPSDAATMHAFVRAHLVDPLTARIGPHLVSAFLDELALEAAHATPSSSPPSSNRPTVRVAESTPRATPISSGASTPPASSQPSSRPRSSRPGEGRTLALIDGDRFRRATTSRMLVGAGFEVIAVDAEEDLRALAKGCDAVVATLGASVVPSLVAQALRMLPRARAVVRTASSADATRALMDVRDRIELTPMSTATSDLVEQILQAARG